jgi:acyl carrier protein
MNVADTTTVEGVKSVLVSTLALEDRADDLNASTPLLGSVPELDSLAVLEVLEAIEQHFGITIEDDDVSAEIFETLGTLAAFVDDKLQLQ